MSLNVSAAVEGPASDAQPDGLRGPTLATLEPRPEVGLHQAREAGARVPLAATHPL